MLYKAALRAELTERLGVEWTAVDDNGAAEIVGVPRALLEQWSARRHELKTLGDELIATRAAPLGVVEVSRSVVVVVGGVAEKSTKTDRSRKVALDPVGIALLTAVRVHVDRWVAEAGGELPPDAFVFSPSVRGAVPYRPDNVTSFFIRVRDAVKAPDVRLHDLRHFTATQLIGAGMDIRTVADFLGHSDPSLTLRVYSHAIEERTKAAASIMGQVLSAERKKPAELTPAQ